MIQKDIRNIINIPINKECLDRIPTENNSSNYTKKLDNTIKRLCIRTQISYKN